MTRDIQLYGVTDVAEKLACSCSLSLCLLSLPFPFDSSPSSSLVSRNVKANSSIILGRVWFRSCTFATNYIDIPQNLFFFLFPFPFFFFLWKNTHQISYFILLVYIWISCLHFTCPDYGNVHIYHNQIIFLTSKQNWEEEEGFVCWRGCWLP